MGDSSKRQKRTEMTVKENSTLMEFLERHYAGMSRSERKKLLHNGQICVNSRVETKFDAEVKKGDRVQVNTGKVSYEMKDTRLKLLYEDEAVVVIDKKEGLLSVSASATKEGPSAFNIILNYLKRKDENAHLYAVHRLDKATSGVMMFAKAVEVQHKMRDNWKKMVTERTYLAITEGVPKQEEGEIESYLHENRAQVVYSGEEEGGKLSITHYRVVRIVSNYAMLKLNLETGRKNQIRVHLSEMGTPILGDRKYNATSGEKKKADSPIGRLALHAKVLEFIHPITGETMRFETPVPREFNAFLINERKRVEELDKVKNSKKNERILNSMERNGIGRMQYNKKAWQKKKR